jgi:WD40 repeat protein
VIDDAQGPLASGGEGMLAGVRDSRSALWRIGKGRADLLNDPESFGFAPVFAQALSPDNRLLAVGGYGGVAMFDISDPTNPTRVYKDREVCGVACLALDFSPDGRLLAAGTRSQQVILWRVEPSGSLALLGDSSGTATSLSTVRFSPRGDLLVGVDQSGSVLVWSVSGPDVPAPMAQLLPADGAARGVAFSDDGAVFAVTNGLAIQLYAVIATGLTVEIGRLEQRDEGIPSQGIVFGRGQTLLSTARNRMTAWDLRSLARRIQEADQTACAIAGQGLTPAEWRSRLPGLAYVRACPPNPSAPSASDGRGRPSQHLRRLTGADAAPASRGLWDR